MGREQGLPLMTHLGWELSCQREMTSQRLHVTLLPQGQVSTVHPHCCFSGVLSPLALRTPGSPSAESLTS